MSQDIHGNVQNAGIDYKGELFIGFHNVEDMPSLASFSTILP